MNNKIVQIEGWLNLINEFPRDYIAERIDALYSQPQESQKVVCPNNPCEIRPDCPSLKPHIKDNGCVDNERCFDCVPIPESLASNNLLREEIAKYLEHFAENWDAYSHDIKVDEVITYDSATNFLINLFKEYVKGCELTPEEICARWGAHPTTGNVGVYSSIVRATISKVMEGLE